MRDLCDADVGHSRSRNHNDVCGADGVRSVQLLAEEIDQGEEATT